MRFRSVKDRSFGSLQCSCYDLHRADPRSWVGRCNAWCYQVEMQLIVDIQRDSDV